MLVKILSTSYTDEAARQVAVVYVDHPGNRGITSQCSQIEFSGSDKSSDKLFAGGHCDSTIAVFSTARNNLSTPFKF